MKVTSTKYSIAITNVNNKSKLFLPVLPESIKIESGVKNDSMTIINFGAVIEKGNRTCHKYSFSSIFPKLRESCVSTSKDNWRTPITFVKKITYLMENQIPVRFVVAGMNISEICLITEFSYEEEAGDVGTYHYDISLKEYRTPKVRKVTKNSSKKKTSRVSSKERDKTYTVKKGDTLVKIAKKKLSSTSYWQSLWDLNKTVIKKSAKKKGKVATKSKPYLVPGTVLKLPS